MKRLYFAACLVFMVFIMSACTGESKENDGREDSHSGAVVQKEQEETMRQDKAREKADSIDGQEEQKESPEIQEDEMKDLCITIGGQDFLVKLYENSATEQLVDMLPLHITMDELNGNEKYYYLDAGLPTDSSVPSGIREGDLMLYGSDCLVLFYKSFTTSYRYTPLGYMEDIQGFAAALGEGSVQVDIAVLQ